MRIEVRVTPRASRNAVGGLGGEGRLRIHVTAPPNEGQANAATSAVLAEAFGVPARKVQLVSGATSRNKVFEIEGDEDQLRVRLAALAGGPRRVR